jgi:hypothetical protein
LAAPRGSAQEATPAAAAEVALPITPDPSLCAAAPVAREPYAAVVGTPGPGTPAAPPPLGPPTGEPADAATVAAVTAVLVEVFACANADDMARLVGFYTPEFWAWGMHPDVFALMAATPTALPEEQWATLVAVREVRVEADGRVAALVEAEQGGTLMVRAFRFVERSGRWLIAEEEIVETRPAEQPAGSPTAEV